MRDSADSYDPAFGRVRRARSKRHQKFYQPYDDEATYVKRAWELQRLAGEDADDATDGLPEGDRWSTWDQSTPTERGPKPHPTWLVTDLAAVDYELGVLKTGKEADVFLVRRGVPGTDRSCLLAAKRYRDATHRQFHRDVGYLEGRRVRESRVNRAVAKRSGFGRHAIAGQWANAEFNALVQLYSVGVPVPYPVQILGTELLLEFIGDADGTGAPRLGETRPEPAELASLWSQLVEAMTILASVGFAHGDLSPYNLLVHHGRLVMIDLPQVVDIIAHPNGRGFLDRDAKNVATWFARAGHPDANPEVLARLLTEEARLALATDLRTLRRELYLTATPMSPLELPSAIELVGLPVKGNSRKLSAGSACHTGRHDLRPAAIVPAGRASLGRRLSTGGHGGYVLSNKLALVGVLTMAIMLPALAGCESHPHQAPRASVAPAPSQAGRRTAASGPATFPGPDGVEARWVIEENDKPGTTAWEIHGSHGGISGFAGQVYAQPGQRVTLYVSTTGPTFRAQAFRMGYYQGKGARLIWTSPIQAGKDQPACPVTAGVNMVSCDNWSPSLTFTVTTAFVQGDYLIKLTGPGHRQSYVPLTIWDPASTAAYVIKNDVFTWQAWNYYGGYDYYQGLGSCPPDVYPVCNRARVVSYDRPYAAEDGSGNFLGLEYPLVRWAEQHGLDVTYATDLTVQEHPGYLLRHKVLLSLGHDECWSLDERQAAVAAYDHGVNIVFFAASPVLRHVRTQASPLGRDRELVDYRDSAADPLDGTGNPLQVTGNEWANPPSSWPEYDFVGDTYAGFLEPGLYVGFTVADASAWVFAGTGLRNGQVVPGVVASDVDKFDLAYGQPADDQILGHSPIPANLGQTSTGAFFSDMTYYTNASTGAGVLDTGTNNWIPALDGLSGCRPGGICEATMVQRITGNILRLFGQGPAARLRPSVPNWRQVTGQ